METCGIFIVAKLSAKNVLQSNLMHLVSGVANDQLNSNRELLSTSLFFTSTSWNMIENKDVLKIVIDCYCNTQSGIKGFAR